MPRRALLLGPLFLLTLAPLLRAQSDAENTPVSSADQVVLDKAKISQLEREVTRLTAQVALLQRQLADLRATTQPAGAKPAAPVDSGPKAYHSVVDIFRELPPDLKAHPSIGWNEQTLPKTMTWLREHAAGKLFQTTIRLSKVNVEVSPAYAKDKSQPKWLITPVFMTDSASYVGIHLVQNVQGKGDQGLAFPGDQAMLHMMEDSRGAEIDVTGTIDELSIETLDSDQGHITVHLTDYKLDFSKVESAAGKKAVRNR